MQHFDSGNIEAYIQIPKCFCSDTPLDGSKHLGMVVTMLRRIGA